MVGLSGKFGNLVFRQMKDGRTVVAALPILARERPVSSSSTIKTASNKHPPMLAKGQKSIRYMRK